MRMRIATWNLERGGTRAARLAQEAVLTTLSADVLVLTEPPASYRGGLGVITSPPQRSGTKGNEAWVAIVGASVESVALHIPFERMAVAARAQVNGNGIVVYGSVLPWGLIVSGGPELVCEGE